MLLFLRPLRFLVQALTAECTPRRLAAGFAIGMVVGLVPKGNLLAIALMTVLCTLRVNLGVAMLAAFLFSWVGLLTDPLTHRIGLSLLTAESLQPTWTALYDLPWMPWTSFNNTVVMGSLALGLALMYPAYRISVPLFERYTPDVSERLKKLKIVQALRGAEWSGKMGNA